MLILKENEAYAIRSDYVLKKLNAGYHVVIDNDLALFQRIWKFCKIKGLTLERFEIRGKFVLATKTSPRKLKPDHSVFDALAD